jgi:hypothetical protein
MVKVATPFDKHCVAVYAVWIPVPSNARSVQYVDTALYMPVKSANLPTVDREQYTVQPYGCLVHAA